MILLLKFKIFKIKDCLEYGYQLESNKLDIMKLENQVKTTCFLFGFDRSSYNVFDIVMNGKKSITILDDKRSIFDYLKGSEAKDFSKKQMILMNLYLLFSVIGCFILVRMIQIFFSLILSY